ncbi:MAG: DUF2155 domain-containing protein [Pseudomonadota bacterium]
MIRSAIAVVLGAGLAIAAISQEAPTPEPKTDDATRSLAEELGFTDDDLAESDDGELEIVPTQRQTFQQKDTVILRALDKITGRSTDFEMLVGIPKVYGSLRIDLQTCFQTPPEEPPESAAFLKVTSATSKQVQTMAEPRDLTAEELAVSEADDADVRFSGWMYASSPGLSALEHPVYDIWVIACSEVVPVEVLPLAPEE